MTNRTHANDHVRRTKTHLRVLESSIVRVVKENMSGLLVMEMERAELLQMPWS